MRPPVDVGVHRAPRCEPVVSLVRSRRAPPVPLIVLPKSCSCRCGPCPRPIPRLACLFSFFLYTHVPTPQKSRGAVQCLDKSVCCVVHALRAGAGSARRVAALMLIPPGVDSSIYLYTAREVLRNWSAAIRASRPAAAARPVEAGLGPARDGWPPTSALALLVKMAAVAIAATKVQAYSAQASGICPG